jgi:hypothetical protein
MRTSPSSHAAFVLARGSLWPAGVWMVRTPTPSGWCWGGPRASHLFLRSLRSLRARRNRACGVVQRSCGSLRSLRARRNRACGVVQRSCGSLRSLRARRNRACGAGHRRREKSRLVAPLGLRPRCAPGGTGLANRNPGSGCERGARIPRRLRRPRSRGGGLGLASFVTEKKVGRRRVALGRHHLTRRSTGFFQLVTSFSALNGFWRGPVLASRSLVGAVPTAAGRP